MSSPIAERDLADVESPAPKVTSAGCRIVVTMVLYRVRFGVKCVEKCVKVCRCV